MFSYGFYNSKNDDRKYNATHFGKIFDGVIQDGIFGTLGSMFSVDPKPTPNLQVTLNPGKAWLMHTWNILDAKTTLTFNQVLANMKRTDVIVLEVNNNYTAEGFEERTNCIKIVQGTNVAIGGSNVVPPLTQIWNGNQTDRRIWQYPLAYITIYGSDYNGNTTATQFEANKIKASSIESRVNISSPIESEKYITWTPLVTGATMNLDLNEYLPDYSNLLDQMMATNTAVFNTWFDSIKGQLSEDAAARLQNELDNKFEYGTEPPSGTITPGRVYFQVEE